MNAPKAKIQAKVLTKHEHERIDNYYWLKEKESPEVITYLKAENAYTKQETKHTENLQEKLYEEIKGRIQQTDMSVPYQKDNYFYYTRQEEGKPYSIFCRKKEHLENAEEVLLNINELAEGHKYYSIAGFSTNKSQEILAYGVDLKGDRICKVYFKDLETETQLTDTLEKVCQFVWANNNKTLFYSAWRHLWSAWKRKGLYDHLESCSCKRSFR